MTPNFAHKIVHSSALYYQNLIMIHECSKKLLKMKNSKSFFYIILLVFSWYPAGLWAWIPLSSDGLSSPNTPPRTTMDTNTLNVQAMPTYRALERKQRHDLHLAYLQQYEQNNIVPKSLLVTIEPTFSKSDSQWRSIIWSTGNQLRDTTITHIREKLQRLDNNFQQRKSELWNSLNPAEYHRTINEIHKRVDKEISELKLMKERKVQRDEKNCKRFQEPEHIPTPPPYPTPSPIIM